MAMWPPSLSMATFLEQSLADPGRVLARPDPGEQLVLRAGQEVLYFPGAEYGVGVDRAQLGLDPVDRVRIRDVLDVDRRDARFAPPAELEHIYFKLGILEPAADQREVDVEVLHKAVLRAAYRIGQILRGDRAMFHLFEVDHDVFLVVADQQHRHALEYMVVYRERVRFDAAIRGKDGTIDDLARPGAARRPPAVFHNGLNDEFRKGCSVHELLDVQQPRPVAREDEPAHGDGLVSGAQIIDQLFVPVLVEHLVFLLKTRTGE